MLIKQNHPVRAAFAGRSTDGKRVGFYETKGHAVDAFDAELRAFDLCFDPNEIMDLNGDTGWRTIPVVNRDYEDSGFAVISWYRMPSGRYEFTGYLA
jgi:hypothetical protein